MKCLPLHCRWGGRKGKQDESAARANLASNSPAAPRRPPVVVAPPLMQRNQSIHGELVRWSCRFFLFFWGGGWEKDRCVPPTGFTVLFSVITEIAKSLQIIAQAAAQAATASPKRAVIYSRTIRVIE